MSTFESDLLKSLPVFDATMAQWPNFRYKFELFLEGRDLLHIWESDPASVVVPSTETAEQKEKREKEFRIADAKVKSYLTSKLSDEVVSLIRDCHTAFAMRKRLSDQFTSSSAATAMMRVDQLLDLEYKGGGTEISKHFGVINGLIQALKDSGGFDIDKFHVVILLRSMPRDADWTAVVQSLKALDEKSLTKERVLRTLTEHAQEIEVARNGKKANPLNAKNQAFEVGNPRKWKNEKVTTSKKNAKPKKVDERRCFTCGETGHFARSCRKSANVKGESNLVKGKECSFMMCAGAATEVDSESWIRDSGATRHYARSRDVFKTYQEVNEKLIVADGREVDIIGIGTVVFEAILPNGRTKRVSLSEVRHAPSLAANLVSTGELDDHGLEERSKKGRTTYFQDGCPVMMAQKIGKRWVMCIKAIRQVEPFDVPPENFLAEVKKLDPELWHRRLGHLSARNMARLGRMVDGFAVDVSGLDRECHVCNLGKIVSKPSKSSANPRMTHPMDLIHMDLVSVSPEGIDGEQYALVMTDDHSECKFSFPLVSKSGEEIWQAFFRWMPWAERMTGRRVKAIRHDNAKEFVVGVFGKHVEELGIEVQLSLPYEHEQNGKAERANRLIIDRARCLMLESGLKKIYWPYAVRTATFLANRSPSSNIDITPIEAFTSIKPDLRSLRVFGAYGWARIPPERRDQGEKMEERAEVVRLLGYGQGGHSYVVLNVRSAEIFMARTVRFDEKLTTEKLISMPGGDLNVGFDDLLEEEEIEASKKTPTGEVDSLPETDMGAESQRRQREQKEPTRRSSRIPVPRNHEWWKVDNRSMVNFAFLTFDSVRSEPDAEKWIEAEREELKNLEEYGVYKEQPLPPGRRAIGSKWVYARGRNPDGSLGKYKARFVVRGFSQVEGVDFFDTFAPVAKPATVRLLFSLAVTRGMRIKQGDV